MPLYTYIAHYQGRTKVEQTRVSNYRGFAASQLARMADRGLLGTSKSLKNEMVGKAYRSPWSSVAELSSVWRTAFELNGDQLELYAVQTKD
jgi:hypothetical protein